uniref:StAR related lipid transfer domain containing 8 n=1 Tax=Dromaius novaehollandiae TaxID=8790 RepID=A0A8C4JL05_DRONO
SPSRDVLQGAARGLGGVGSPRGRGECRCLAGVQEGWAACPPGRSVRHAATGFFLGLLQKSQEVEAKKACDWLRAAGFPQYAQLYEDSLFPLDIVAVKKDHSFLDQDSLKSLCRRLMTLNTCASMKLEVHFQRKQVSPGL